MPHRLGVRSSGSAHRRRPRASFALLVALLARAAGGDTFTVDEAVERALAASRSIAESVLAVERAQRTLSAARADRLPRLEISVESGQLVSPVAIVFRQGDLGELPGAGPVPAVDTSIESGTGVMTLAKASLAQPLAQLHRLGLAVELRETALAAASETLRGERQAVAHAAKTLYYDLAATEGELAACRESIRAAMELVRHVQDLVGHEAALDADLLDAQARLAGERARELALTAALESGRERLNDLMGREPGTELELEPLADPEAVEAELSVAALVARAREVRSDLRRATLSGQAAELEREVERAAAIPDLSLAISYGAIRGIDYLPDEIAQVGLAFRWEPFDWGRRHHRIAEKQLAAESARVAADDAAARAAIEVGSRARRERAARVVLDARRLAHDAAQERLRVETERYGRQAALFRALLDAQAAAADAGAALWRAKADFWTAHADLELAVGDDPRGAR